MKRRKDKWKMKNCYEKQKVKLVCYTIVIEGCVSYIICMQVEAAR